MSERRVKLTFLNDKIKDPLIYQMGHEFNVVTNIRMADITSEIGWVMLGLVGETTEIDKALAWAQANGIQVDPDATVGDIVEG
ncbi:MAG: NIL domain-containing protein [Dehalococcoidia bacterium]|jgi:ABC-type methionine transport system ATPase subunit|nr:NIL domain-containing protein [Dehalococcoidia bacterium]